jgi:hypothetical protein
VSKARRRHNRRIAVRRTPKPSTKAICVTYEEGVGRIVGGTLLDISLFGAGLAIEQALAAGSEVAVGLEVPGEPNRALIIAKVVWCSASANGGNRIGVHFQQPLASAFFQALCDA